MKILLPLFLIIIVSACQTRNDKNAADKAKLNNTDTLTILFQKLHNMESKLESMQKKDDSIYHSIINRDNYAQPVTKETFNYEQIKNDYQEFITHYGNYLQTSNFPVGLPMDSVHNKLIIGFGNKLQPVYKIKQSHMGIDIPASKGKSIKSTVNGNVLSAKEANWRDGNQVIIQSNKHIKVVFSHLDKILVKKGATVQYGQIIGRVGSSGMSVAHHLHYEIIINDVAINQIFVLFKQFTKEDLEYVFTKNCQSLD